MVMNRKSTIHAKPGRKNWMGEFILALTILVVAIALGVAVGGNDHRKR